jgi:hypothetical protein
MGRVGRVPETRELVITGTPSIAAYRVAEDTMVILRVLHGARRWPEQFDTGVAGNVGQGTLGKKSREQYHVKKNRKKALSTALGFSRRERMRKGLRWGPI